MTLTQNNLFVFPSPAGFLFLLLLLGLLLGGINYENNMLFLSAFLLGSLFVVAILHTFGNLAGLTLRAGHAHPVFAGHDARFDIALRGAGRGFHDSILLQWSGAGYHRAFIEGNNECIIHMHVPAAQRGWFHPGRLLVQSFYPLGLIRVWSHIDLDSRCLVYPKPVAAPPLPESYGRDPQGEAVNTDGGEDFSGFRRYQTGDPLRHVAWKAAAKGGPLLSKQYSDAADKRTWLDWDVLEDVSSTELRLSILCYWALQFEAEYREYGLRLPGTEIPPGSGSEHRDAILRALALFRLPETENA